MTRTAWLCDFDGTVSPRDIGAALVRAYAAGRERDLDALLDRWRAGTIGHRELTERQCGLLAVGEDEARAFVLRFALDPGFAPFVREARARGDEVMVVSEGFDFYLDALLAREGLADLPRAANRLTFGPGGTVRATFPHPDPACGSCGNCKGQHARAWRGRGFRTALVGDGLSDRCGAREADLVFARGDLLAWCTRERIPAEPFAEFADVAARARATA